MMIQLAQRMQQVKASPTMALNAKANELKAQGKKIINLTVGEPDFDTPGFIKDAAIQAIHGNFTRYTPAEGIAELKEAIVHKLKVDNKLDYSLNQIVATNGAKQAIYSLIQAVLNEGDEAIIPAPYWVSYLDMVLLAGSIPVIVPASIEQNFKITPWQLQQAITPKTRLLFLNSPSNPSGMAYTLDELKALGEVLKSHPQIIIVSDDIYEYILWGMPQFVNILNACPELTEQTVIVNGVSKAYAMTGWRLGYAAGPRPLIQAISNLQSHSTSCCCSITQKAAVAGLTAKRDFFVPMLAAYKQRHDLMFAGINQIDGMVCKPADGTFYIFPQVEKLMAKRGLPDDISFANLLLEEANIATVPGSAFGTPGYIRFSCATNINNLETALQCMQQLFV